VEVLSNLNVKPLCTNVKPPYSRLSGGGSGLVHSMSMVKIFLVFAFRWN